MTTPLALPAAIRARNRRRVRRLPHSLEILPQRSAMTMVRSSQEANGLPPVATVEAAVMENRLGA